MTSGRLAALAACALLAGPVRAEPPTVVLPPVLVPAPRPGPDAGPVAREEPTASRSTVEVRELSGRVRDVAEALATLPGVLSRESGGFGQPTSLSIRGAGSNGVLVLLDGLPLNGPGGIADTSRVPLPLLRQVEVARGPLGARYGSGGLGGVVNLVTRAPTDGPSLSANLAYGSFATLALDLAASAPLGPLRALALASLGASRGDFPFLHDELPALEGSAAVRRWRVNNDSRRVSGLLKLEAELADTALSGMVEVSWVDRGLAGTVHHPTSDARERGLRVSLAARGTRRLGAGTRLAVELAARRSEDQFKGGYFGEGLAQRASAGQLRARLEHALHGHLLTAEAELGLDHLRASGGAAPSWWRGALLVRDEVTALDGRLLIAGSLRAEAVGPFRLVSPRLGAELDLGPGVALYANAASAARAPSFLELYVAQGSLLPNPDLVPERAHSADLGLRLALPGLGSASLGAFYAHYSELILYEYYPPFLARPFNLGSAHAWGLELEGAFRAVPWAQVTAGYTWLSTQNLEPDFRYRLRPLPYRPVHRAALRATLGPPALTATAELAVQSRQYMNRSQSERMVLPDRAVLNLSASWLAVALPQLRLTAEVKNALDAQLSDLDGYPLPGRALYLSLGLDTEPIHAVSRPPRG